MRQAPPRRARKIHELQEQHYRTPTLRRCLSNVTLLPSILTLDHAHTVLFGAFGWHCHGNRVWPTGWRGTTLCSTIFGAVDQDDVVLGILVQVRRDANAATRFFIRVLKGLRCMSLVIVTDKSRNYGAAKRRLFPDVKHRQSRCLDNGLRAATRSPAFAGMTTRVDVIATEGAVRRYERCRHRSRVSPAPAVR
jgi:DDE domain